MSVNKQMFAKLYFRPLTLHKAEFRKAEQEFKEGLDERSYNIWPGVSANSTPIELEIRGLTGKVIHSDKKQYLCGHNYTPHTKSTSTHGLNLHD